MDEVGKPPKIIENPIWGLGRGPGILGKRGIGDEKKGNEHFEVQRPKKRKS